MADRGKRAVRRHAVGIDDQRGAFERDRDRILYSSAFRRLAGVTQIVRAGEADVFHTRQQHTLKVAQVGLRLAEKCVREQGDAAVFHGVEPEVVEAACLAHDLGHPPFGHIGEKALDRLVRDAGDEEGFEGNAQTFRIVTRLAVRFEVCDGLDLTRATLAACLKYPWFRIPSDPDKSGKWGAYRLDKDDFDFAREGVPSDRKTAEAELMDWADDIAYSVHDLEDFHRCGVIPWHRLFRTGVGKAGSTAESTIGRAVTDWYRPPTEADGRLRQAFGRLESLLMGAFERLLTEPYEATKDQRQQLRSMNSILIGRYIRAAKLSEADSAEAEQKPVLINDNEADEVRILKQITRDYIIENPSLAAQQKGHQRILDELFGMFLEDTKASHPKYLPHRLRSLWSEGVPSTRFVADCLSSLTEAEVIGLHARLAGRSSGSVLDPIVR